MALYGSVTNRISENKPASVDDLPAIGDGATEYSWSDRDPYTVVAIEGTAKRPIIIVQDDIARVVSGSTHDGSARYAFEPNPDATRHEVMLRKKGGQLRWCFVYRDWDGKRQTGNVITFGHRDAYEDPSF